MNRSRIIKQSPKEGKVPRDKIREAVLKVKYKKYKSSCHGARLAVLINPKTDKVRFVCQLCACFCEPVKK